MTCQRDVLCHKLQKTKSQIVLKIGICLTMVLFFCLFSGTYNFESLCCLRSLFLLQEGISSVQSLSRVRLFATPEITACQASLSITNSWSSLKLTSTEAVMPSSHLILRRPLFLLPSIFPRIRVFSSSSYQVAKVSEFQLQHQPFQ